MVKPEYKTHAEIIQNLNIIGWKQLPKNHYDKAYNNYIIKPILEEVIYSINYNLSEKYNISEDDKNKAINGAINKLLYENNPEKILEYLKEGITINLDKGKKGIIKVRVNLIDYENIDKNTFHYAHELKFKGEYNNIVPDFTLFVNGIPIVIIEAKREYSESEEYTYEEAIRQINRYEREAPRLFNYVQFAVAYGDEKVYIPTYPNFEKTERYKIPYHWKNEKKEDDIFDLLNPIRVLNIIQNFTFFSQDRAGNLTKIIPRYMQYWGVNKAFHRIKKYIEGKENKNRGLIWHWQGSGKTYEIIYLAELFYKTFKNRNPAVFIIVDRKDLEDQFDKDIKALRNAKFKDSFRRIENTKELENELTLIKESEYKNISRSMVYLVMMHKFDKNKLKEFVERFDNINKKEILILRDEAHRTESGKFATLRNKIFKNAILIGFTGTPIHNKEKNTFNEYAYPKEGELYLDKFFIEESIKEGFTLPLIWRLVNPKYIKNKISEEQIKELIEELFVYRDMDDNDENIEDIKISKDEIYKKFTLSDLLKSESSIKEASKYIANNILEDTENFKFKALVVAQDRKSCILFKKYLDEELKKKIKNYTPEWTQVVITYQHNEEDIEIENYKKEIEKKYNLKVEELNKKWAEDFTKKEIPKILIVNRKLLTGFDAPILKVIYIHQLLKDYLLLQASARANRPFKCKNYGLIVDLTGILIENYKKAIEKYKLYLDDEINKDILSNLFVESSMIWESFLNKLDKFKTLFEDITGYNFDELITNLESGKISTNEFKNIINKIVLNEKLKYFYYNLRELINLFEEVGAYGEKINYYNTYEWLKVLSAAINKQKNPKKYKIPYNKIKKEAIKYLEFSPYETITSIKLSAELLENLTTKEVDNIIADVIYIMMDELEDKPEPIYKVIYRRVKELRDKYIQKTEKAKNIAEELIKYYNKMKEYQNEEKNISLYQKAIKNIIFYLREQGYNIEKLPFIEKELKKLENRKLIKQSDFKKIKNMLFIDLKHVIDDIKLREELSIKITNEIIKPIYAQKSE